MSPEVRNGKAYGKEADLWAFGILMRVMLTGYLEAPSACWKVWKAKRHQLRPRLSASASEALKQLLDPKLANRAKRVNEVKGLTFFQSIRWGLVKEGMMKPPLQPASFALLMDWLKKRRPETDNGLLSGRVLRENELDPEYAATLAHRSYHEFGWVSTRWKSRHGFFSF
jgi:serine/threonine protein kinase